jgi:hypothetical protein
MAKGMKRHIAGQRPSRYSRRSLRTVACSIFALCVTPALTIAQSNTPNTQQGNAQSIVSQPSDFEFVDCRIPGRVVQNGRRQVRQLPSRLVRITSEDCEIFGGRYIVSARASIEGALQAWLPQADAGDPKAQTYVGELYERGMNGVPNFERAREWYGRAVQKGHAPAMISLARLFEEGLGGPADQVQATELYYDAMGFEGDLRAKLTQVDTAELIMLRASLAERDEMLARQETTINRLHLEIDGLKTERDDASARYLQLETELAAAREQLAGSLASAANGRESLRTEIDAVRQQRVEIEQREQALANKELELARLQNEIANSVQTQSAQDQALVNQLRADLANAQNAIAQLQAERRSAVAAEAAALSAVSDAESDLFQRLNALAEREHSLAQRENELAELTQKYGDDSLVLNAEREDLQRERAELAVARTEFSDQQRRFESVRATYNQRRSNLTVLEREIAEQRAALAEESTRLEAAAANVLSLEQDRAALNSLMEAQRQEQAALESAKQEYMQRSAALDARESEMAQRQREITHEIERLANSETQYAELTRQKDEAVARADRLEEQLADATARLDKLAELASRGLAAPEEQVAQTEPVSPYANIDFGDYHAILIGNQDYHNENWVDLQTPHKDVDDISKILRTKYGFQTTVLKDLTRMELGQALAEKAAGLDQSDNLLIYYAGHGQRINDVAYWDPVDSIPYNSINSLSFDWLKETLSASAAKKIMVVSDSCYSGVITRSVTTITSGDDPVLEAEHVRYDLGLQTRVALTSGGADQEVLDEGGGGNSLFAEAFIQTLNNNAQIARASVLARSVTDIVSARAFSKDFLQAPQYGEMQNSGSHGGEFFFVPFYSTRT